MDYNAGLGKSLAVVSGDAAGVVMLLGVSNFVGLFSYPVIVLLIK